MRDFLQENKVLCSVWGWDQMKALFAGMLHIPVLTLHNDVSNNHIPTSNPFGKAPWRVWLSQGTDSSAPSHLLLLPHLPHSQHSFSQSHNNLCQQSPPGIKSHFFFQRRTLQNSKRCGAGGAQDCLAFSYVMDEHTPLMLLKRFNVWYSPNGIKGTENWKQGMFTITGTWRAVMSQGKINFSTRGAFPGHCELVQLSLFVCLCLF